MNISIPPLNLEASLDIPCPAHGVVLFAHGSGSSRLSRRNNHVAAALREARLATLLFDLLSAQEARDRTNVFDIDLLAERLLMASEWLRGRADIGGLPIGYFGASTGAAAALVAASASPRPISAIVSRGGRPDLATAALPVVTSPTLLIVGNLDVEVLALNQAALAELRAPKALEVVAGATHLFEEPGALDAVIVHARSWFEKHLAQVSNAVN